MSSFCFACGAPRPQLKPFCTNCGTKQPSQSSDDNGQFQPPVAQAPPAPAAPPVRPPRLQPAPVQPPRVQPAPVHPPRLQPNPLQPPPLQPGPAPAGADFYFGDAVDEPSDYEQANDSGMTVSKPLIDALKDDLRNAPAERSTRWRVMISDGQSAIVEHSLLLGRAPRPEPGNDVLAVADPEFSVSKTHLRLEIRSGTVWVTDVHSTNGVRFADTAGVETWLEAGVPTPVPANCRVLFGGLAIELHPEEVEEPADSPPPNAWGRPPIPRVASKGASGLIESVPLYREF